MGQAQCRPRYEYDDDMGFFVDMAIIDQNDGTGQEMTTVDVLERLNALEARLSQALEENEQLKARIDAALEVMRYHDEAEYQPVYDALTLAADAAEGGKG